jgi:hypothetical protein
VDEGLGIDRKGKLMNHGSGVIASLTLGLVFGSLADASGWQEGSKQGSGSLWGVVGQAAMALNSNPAFLPDHAIDTDIKTDLEGGFDLESPYGLDGVWSALGYGGWANQRYHLALAIQHQNWLGLWQQEGAKVSASWRLKTLSLGASWDPNFQKMENVTTWSLRHWTTGTAMQMGSLQGGLTASGQAFTTFPQFTLGVVYTWLPTRAAALGSFAWAGKLPLIANAWEQSQWGVAYTWGPGFRMEMAWAQTNQELGMVVFLPWDAWSWVPHWRNQGLLGRTLGAGIHWQRNS